MDTAAKARLLIVDDKELFLRSVERFLSRDGYDVCTACNGVEALKHLEERDVDLVMTDIKMPEMDGIELLKRIRKLYGDLTVIVLTAFGSEEMEKEARVFGAVDYIEKPAGIERIKDVIERRLRDIRRV